MPLEFEWAKKEGLALGLYLILVLRYCFDCLSQWCDTGTDNNKYVLRVSLRHHKGSENLCAGACTNVWRKSERHRESLKTSRDFYTLQFSCFFLKTSCWGFRWAAEKLQKSDDKLTWGFRTESTAFSFMGQTEWESSRLTQNLKIVSTAGTKKASKAKRITLAQQDCETLGWCSKCWLKKLFH